MENGMKVPQKIELSCNPIIPFLGMYPKGLKAAS